MHERWHYAITPPPPVNPSALMQLRHSVVKGFAQIVNRRHIHGSSTRRRSGRLSLRPERIAEHVLR
jgi:hypothetical protein